MKRITILGAGESGVGAAMLARHLGFSCFVSDFGYIKDIYKEELELLGVEFEEGGHSEKIYNCDICIKSPGIPSDVPIVKEIIKKNIEVVSEIEFASRYTDSFIVAVTGSNGKTTTASLIYHILKSANKDVALVGNIGYSLARQMALDPKEIYVIEVSSFQLDDIRLFKPNISILLNISPDHLDRYKYDESLYAASKWRIALNLDQNDVLIVNENLQEVKDEKSYKRIKIYQDETKIVSYNGVDVNLDIAKVKGLHNLFNLKVAVNVAQLLGVPLENLKEGLMTFEAIEHRMEFVAKINGISYINDSKATNLDAVKFALGAMVDPVVWVVGGIDKGNLYEELDDLVKDKVKAIVCLGADNKKLRKHFHEFSNIVEVMTANEAVQKATEFSEEGDVVLLSPACSSFDLFANYAERGVLFKKAVLNLENN